MKDLPTLAPLPMDDPAEQQPKSPNGLRSRANLKKPARYTANMGRASIHYGFIMSVKKATFPENLIVDYGEVNRQVITQKRYKSRTPHTHQKTTPHEPTGKLRDRVGSSGCLHPEQDIRPPQRPQLGRRRGRAYYPLGKSFLLKDHRE